jgi:hypothetical protein
VSFQITVLKVLAGSPGGCLSLADDLRHDVALLISSGRDWTEVTKRIAARAPDHDNSVGRCKFVGMNDNRTLVSESGLI